jgi:hypothetical protein
MYLLVFVLAVFALVRSDSATEATPSLRLVAKEPIAVAGRGFRSGERVRLVALGSLKRVSVTTEANERGTFKVSFPPLGADRCSPLVVAAIGSQGSRASVKVLRRPCQPPRLPPSRR